MEKSQKKIKNCWICKTLKGGDNMKRILNIINCGLGGFLVGKFANQLNTPEGIALFIAGVTLMTVSICLLSQNE